MWKLKLKSCLRTRKLLCKALCLVLFCSFAPVVKADLTQAQMQAAVYGALVQASDDLDGYTWWNSYPTDDTGEPLSSYLTYGQYNVAWSLFNLFSQVSALRSAFLSYTNDIVTSSQFSDELQTLSEDHLGFLDYLGGYTYTDSSELRVHDDGLNELVSNMVFDAGGLGADMSSSLSQLIGISQDLEYIRGQFEAEAALDVTGVVATARAQTEQEYEDALDEAMEEAGDIPLPTEQDYYETEAADATGADTSDIFGDLSTTVTHSAILQLVPRNSEIVPEIEVDFGRISAFETMCHNLNTLTDWLYPLLGTLLLSLKGVGMWKKVRQASTIASASGEAPTLTLDWRPF